VTVKLQVLLLPQLSAAVLCTVVAPMGNRLPLGGVEMMFNEPQPPLAVTLKNTAAPLELAAGVVIGAEQVMLIGCGGAFETTTNANAVLLPRLGSVYPAGTMILTKFVCTPVPTMVATRDIVTEVNAGNEVTVQSPVAGL
jgi:hypothetical protein